MFKRFFLKFLRFFGFVSKGEKTRNILLGIGADHKKRLQELKDTIASVNDRAMFVDGHDDAIVGWSTDGRVIYIVDLMLGTLIERDGMTEEEADEFFSFNIECAYVGKYTPIYMYEE